MDLEFYGFLLVFLFLIGGLHYFLDIYKQKSFTKKKLPPGPNGLPIIGSFFTIGDRPHESLAMLAKTYGPLMSLQTGLGTTIVASSIEMAREILVKNDHAFLGRPISEVIMAVPAFGQRSVVCLSGGQQWKKLRKIFNTHIFKLQKLDESEGLRELMMDTMIQQAVEESESLKAIDIGKLVFCTMFNLLSKMIFSVDTIDLSSREIQDLREVIGKIMEVLGKPNLADYFPFLKPFDPQGIRRDMRASYARLSEYIDNFIHRRMTRRTSGSFSTGDLLDVFLDDRLEEIDLQDFKVLLMDLLIGGTDTSTTTVEWGMAELLRNPTIMAKAKKELCEKIVPELRLKEQDMPRLPYLEAVIKETMRLHATSPLLLPHCSVNDVEINGFTIPKHTQVLVNAWLLSRDEAYWDEPLKFMPERFMNSVSDADFRGRNLSFIPFGSGRRICPGHVFAVRMVSLILATLLHNFDWRLPDGMAPEDIDMKEKFGITLKKAEPLLAIPAGGR